VRFHLTLRIRAGQEEVRPLRPLVEAAAALAGMPGAGAAETALAVHEALANVLRHGYRGDPTGRVTVRLRGSPGELVILLADACEPVPSETICARAWDDRAPGGMGVPLIRKVMDVVEHRPRPGRGNVLRLVRRDRGAGTEGEAC
jgi:anti-sigma regulatory factor (Ser/Thr protein kinase)